MATSPRDQSAKQIMKQISYGMRNSPRGSGGMGAMMGFMGLPFMSRGESYGGPFSSIDPLSPDFWGRVIGRNGTQAERPPLPPRTPSNDGAGQPYWQFPQYSQTWAFTPPEPTPYLYPQPFDPKKYGNPFAKDKK